MKKKGFATSAILYTMLLLFLVLLVGILNNLQNKKTILDTMKKDTVMALQLSTIVEDLLTQVNQINIKINDIETIIGKTDISQIADGTITGVIAKFHQGGSSGESGGSTTCEYEIGTKWEFEYNGENVQAFAIPCDGTYQLEVWGAQGAPSAKGGYSVGYKKFKRDQNPLLYIVVGGQGSIGRGTTGKGGYNGGGNGVTSGGTGNLAGGGGGATHIAITNLGVLSAYKDHQDEVLIVAGGGGGGAGYSNKWINSGSAGGGTSSSTSAFGQGASGTNPGLSQGGGGGGWAGGTAGVANGSAGYGGTGYIGGVPPIILNDIAYSPEMQNGQQSGNGKAQITLVSLNS